jgi:hypothetical protein
MRVIQELLELIARVDVYVGVDDRSGDAHEARQLRPGSGAELADAASFDPGRGEGKNASGAPEGTDRERRSVSVETMSDMDFVIEDVIRSQALHARADTGRSQSN